MAPVSARARREPASANGARTRTENDQMLLARELAAVAEYIGRLKQEIGALRVNELRENRLPSAHRELGTVVKATASATHDIMSAAEAILTADDATLDRYRSRVESNVLAIFEACSFQDITGQRIAKVADPLAQLEQRLGRFAATIPIRDASAPSEAEAAVLRREVL